MVRNRNGRVMHAGQDKIVARDSGAEALTHTNVTGCPNRPHGPKYCAVGVSEHQNLGDLKNIFILSGREGWEQEARAISRCVGVMNADAWIIESGRR